MNQEFVKKQQRPQKQQYPFSAHAATTSPSISPPVPRQNSNKQKAERNTTKKRNAAERLNVKDILADEPSNTKSQRPRKKAKSSCPAAGNGAAQVNAAVNGLPKPPSAPTAQVAVLTTCVSARTAKAASKRPHSSLTASGPAAAHLPDPTQGLAVDTQSNGLNAQHTAHTASASWTGKKGKQRHKQQGSSSQNPAPVTDSLKVNGRVTTPADSAATASPAAHTDDTAAPHAVKQRFPVVTTRPSKHRSSSAAAIGSNWKALQQRLAAEALDKQQQQQGNGYIPRKRFRKGANTAGTLQPSNGGLTGGKQIGSIGHTAGATAVLALDCEMVGVGPGGERDALARISIVSAWAIPVLYVRQ